MIFKYYLSISGDNLFPEKIINRIEGNFIIDSYYSPTDGKFEDRDDPYGYGGISFWHPKKFSLKDNIVEYEESFVKFIEDNYLLFSENGLEDIEIFLEIYFDGGQCNFEIFDKTILKRLAKYDVSLPISVYILGKRKFKKWRNEIESVWNNVK